MVSSCSCYGGNTFYCFVNGILYGSKTGRVRVGKAYCTIGAMHYNEGSNTGCFNGYINNIKISSIAKWTSDFSLSEV